MLTCLSLGVKLMSSFTSLFPNSPYFKKKILRKFLTVPYSQHSNAGNVLYYIDGLLILDILSLAACFLIFEKFPWGSCEYERCWHNRHQCFSFLC